MPEGREDRGRDRHHDRPEGPELVGAVHPGGFEQFVGDAQHELAHQEDPERAGEERQDQTRVGVHEAEIAHQDEIRDEGDPGRDHERGQDERHDHALAVPAQLGKRVAEHRAEDERADSDGQGDDRRVEEEPREVQLVEQAAVVVHRRGGWQEGGWIAEEVGFGLQGTQHHPQERPDHEHEARDQEDVAPLGRRLPAKALGGIGRGQCRHASDRRKRNCSSATIATITNRT